MDNNEQAPISAEQLAEWMRPVMEEVGLAFQTLGLHTRVELMPAAKEKADPANPEKETGWFVGVGVNLTIMRAAAAIPLEQVREMVECPDPEAKQVMQTHMGMQVCVTTMGRMLLMLAHKTLSPSALAALHGGPASQNKIILPGDNGEPIPINNVAPALKAVREGRVGGV